MNHYDPDNPDRCPKCDKKNWSGDLCSECRVQEDQDQW